MSFRWGMISALGRNGTSADRRMTPPMSSYRSIVALSWPVSLATLMLRMAKRE